MKQKQKIRTLLQQAKSIRQRSRASNSELQNYLFYQLNLIQGNSFCFPCARLSTQGLENKKQFKKAYKKLSQEQKAQFYLSNVRSVQKIIVQNNFKTINGNNLKHENNSFPDMIIMKAEVKDNNFFPKFVKSNLQLIKHQQIIKIQGLAYPIQLRKFLIRESKRSNCIALQPCQSNNHQQTIRIRYNQSEYRKYYKLIYEVWEYAQYENIKQLLKDGNKQLKRLQTNGLLRKNLNSLDIERDQLKNLKSSNNLILSSKEFQKIDRVNNSIARDDIIQSLNSFKQFVQEGQNLFYHQNGQIVRKMFLFNQNQTNFQIICKQIDDIRHIKERKPYILQIRHLSSLPSEKTNLYREIDLLGDQKIQFVYLRHYQKREDTMFFFEKSINLQQFKNKSQNIHGKINHLIWRIRRVGKKIQIISDAHITYSNKLKNMQQITSLYIGQINKSIKNLRIQENRNFNHYEQEVNSQQFENMYLSQIDEQQCQFFTAIGTLKTRSQKVVQFSEQSLSEQDNIPKSPIQILQSSSNQIYTAHRFQTNPNKKGKSVYMVEQGSLILWGNDWIINPKGQLVYTNQQKIKMQTGVVKLLIKRLGKSILSGSSIMTMSLPVQIFSTQSNLQRLARCYCYGPLFLQQAEKMFDPVQRLKKVFCFGLGMAVVYTMVQKPFNPVLGQTYQGSIDGCPIYCEQISHHPPISSLLLIGRGYRVYSNLQAKVNIGFNVVSGINQGFNIIQFQSNKGKVKFNSPSGDMHGLLFSQRRLYFSKKSLLLQIVWGKQSSRRSQSKLNDFFCGKITKIKQGVNIDDYTKIKPKDIQTTYGQIHGRFTGKVYFQDDLIFDVNADAPYLISNYEPSLASDSRFRKDVIERKKNDYQSAQTAKQQIQQIQRRDRKLRNNH